MDNDPTDFGRTLRSRMNPMLQQRASLFFSLNTTQLRAIPEAVKDRILDWALRLEEQGVHGENMTFSEGEKQAANSITFNLTNCTIEQLNNMGRNHKGIS